MAFACVLLPALAVQESPSREQMSAALARGAPRPAAISASLARFYAARGFEPAWFAGGRPSAQAVEIIELLRSAASHGLDEADYQPDVLERRLRQAPAEAAETDVALTGALIAFLADLDHGRLEPQRLGFDLPERGDPPDIPKAIIEAAAGGGLSRLAAQFAPLPAMYGRLREALARYRALAENARWSALPPVARVRPGDSYPGLGALRRRLIDLGDLAPEAALPPLYSGEIVEAVRRFQDRHGLDADGIIGKATRAALDVPPKHRVRQIELALERMRWLPRELADRMIVVNVPEFRLRALRRQGERMATVLRMNVIVGKALDTRTPVLIEDLRRIEFRPYWNVPPSIARKEIVPRLRRDPGYLAREAMEFVPVRGRGPATTEVSEAALAAVLRGEARIRQRPGPKNALGAIKFVFPNNANIYLHHTPGTRLFARGRRDFSHGCIRVELPVELAKFVLEDEPGWNEARIVAAMREDAPPRTLPVRTRTPVLVFYSTTVVEEDGRVLFLPDIYGHDAALDAALRQRSTPAL